MPSKPPAQKSRPPRQPKPLSASSAKIAVLSDIHSNLHALAAVLEACRALEITRFWCLGDTVGYGAYPAECLKLIRSLGSLCVLGNHDWHVASGGGEETLNDYAIAGIKYSRRKLPAGARKWLGERPEVITGSNVTLVHSALPEPLEWAYIFTRAEARPTLLAQTTPLCFYGHTHVPRLFVADESPTPEQIGERKYRFHRNGRALLNPGSVGQPRGGDPRARFAVFDPVDLTAEFRAVEYDTEGAAEAICAAGLPEYLGERLIEGV